MFEPPAIHSSAKIHSAGRCPKGTKSRLHIFVALLLPLFCLSCQDQSLNLTDLQSWAVVLADDATPAERYAASEFISLFGSLTGKHLPVSSRAGARHNIFIGPGDELFSRFPQYKPVKMDEEELQLLVEKDNIVIFGGRPRGTLYGVYEFCERYLNMRFLTFDHTAMPDNARSIQIPLESYTWNPPFKFRWSFFGENRNHPEFAARLRVNTVTRGDSLGGITGQRLINHSFRRQIPVEKYGREHPEYFALVRGERKLKMWGGGPQPCPSDPQVADILTEALLQEIEEHPARSNYSLSQNDNDAYCRCPQCEKLNQAEGSPMAAHLKLVNTVAERIEQVYPDKYIGTLAYWYTRRPPKTIKPRHNVQIQLADIEACRVHAIDDPDCPLNRSFYNDLLAWSEKTDQIYIWTYVTDFRYYDLPFPNLRQLSANFKFYRDHGVKGVFAQSHGGSTSGDISDLRNYVIARCLWHPERDSWQEALEFCKLHYGRAAAEIIDYLRFVHDNIESKGRHPHCFATPAELGLDRETALKMLSSFKRALDLAESDVVCDRVEKISLSAYRALLEAGADFAVEGGRLRRIYPEQYADVIETYIGLAEKHGLSHADERTPLAKYKAILESDYRNGVPVAVLENDDWRLVVNYADNGKMVQMLHKPSGRNFVNALRTNLKYGTFEEWIEKDPDHNAPQPEFKATVYRNSLKLSRTLKGGASYIREIFFAGDEKERIFFRTTLHQQRGQASYQIIVHPEFNCGSTSASSSVVSAYVYKDNGWQVYNKGLYRDQGPDAALLTSAVGGGKQAFFNHEQSFGLVEQYDPAYIRKLRTWWEPAQEQLNLELETKTLRLSAGQTISLEYSFKFIDKAPDTDL